MTTTNGIDTTDITTEETLHIIHSKRADVRRQRKALEIDHRIQKKIGASADALREIEESLRRCEIALDELEEIERECTP